MPRRYNTRSRTVFRRTRRVRRRMPSAGRSRIVRPLKDNVHHFKRTFQGADLAISNAGANPGGLSFLFGSLPSVTDFTTLFDQYRINLIKVQFVPNFTGGDLNPAATFQTIPNLHTVIDHDDAATPGSLNVLLQYTSMKMTRGSQTHTRLIKPTTLANIGGVNNVGHRYKTWIDMTQTTIPHFGLKYWIDQSNGTSGTFRSYITYYFSCSGVR